MRLEDYGIRIQGCSVHFNLLYTGVACIHVYMRTKSGIAKVQYEGIEKFSNSNCMNHVWYSNYIKTILSLKLIPKCSTPRLGITIGVYTSRGNYYTQYDKK